MLKCVKKMHFSGNTEILGFKKSTASSRSPEFFFFSNWYSGDCKEPF